MNRLIQRSIEAMREGGVSRMVAKAHGSAVKTAIMGRAGVALRRELEPVERLEERLDVINRFKYRGVEVMASQIAPELLSLLSLLQTARPRTLLEIGTGLGGTTLLFATVAPDGATVITIDLPIGPSRRRLLAGAAGARKDIHVLRRDSHDERTFRKVHSTLRGRLLDFLFIDGDHSYQGVQRDYSLYAPLVRPGGFLGFHDVVPGPQEFVGGVPRFWEELKAKGAGEIHEFVEDWGQGGLGIGVITKP